MSSGTPRYVVGIDLGTTHSALAMAKLGDGTGDAAAEHAIVESFAVPQLVSASAVQARELLPSFFYVANAGEGALPLPWDATRTFAVGAFARERGVESPGRVVSSAKSWLSHAGVDRRGAILPVGAADDVERISPVEASTRYLRHGIGFRSRQHK